MFYVSFQFLFMNVELLNNRLLKAEHCYDQIFENPTKLNKI